MLNQIALFRASENFPIHFCFLEWQEIGVAVEVKHRSSRHKIMLSLLGEHMEAALH